MSALLFLCPIPRRVQNKIPGNIILPYARYKSPAVARIILELHLIPIVGTARHKGLIREHPRQNQLVTLPYSPAPMTGQQIHRSVNQHLCEVVRTRHVLKPPFHRHRVGIALSTPGQFVETYGKGRGRGGEGGTEGAGGGERQNAPS